jgi:hypothetical protein
VPDPLACLAEMSRVTVSGATVAALGEADWRTIEYAPPCEGMDELVRLLRQMISAQGGDPDVGGRVSELFHDSKLVDVRVDSAAVRSSVSGKTLHARGYVTLAQGMLADATAQGLISANEAAAVVGDVDRWCSGPDSVLCWPKTVRVRARCP